VGAADHDGNLADFSNSGKHLSLVAPGSYGGSCFGVLVALPAESAIDDSCYPRWTSADGARYAYLAGTSFAAPEVAGVAALVWAVRPDLANYEVADIIKQSARRETAGDWTPTRGCGELDADKAVELAMAYPDRPQAAGASRDACGSAGDESPSWPSEVDQTIAFPPIPVKTVGDPDFRIRATASSGLSISLSASGDCTIRHATVHLIRAGSCSVTAAQPGNTNYDPAPTLTRSFSIAAAPTWSVHAAAAAEQPHFRGTRRRPQTSAYFATASRY
jgi:hypothetical protein